MRLSGIFILFTYTKSCRVSGLDTKRIRFLHFTHSRIVNDGIECTVLLMKLLCKSLNTRDVRLIHDEEEMDTARTQNLAGFFSRFRAVLYVCCRQCRAPVDAVTGTVLEAVKEETSVMSTILSSPHTHVDETRILDELDACYSRVARVSKNLCYNLNCVSLCIFNEYCAKSDSI